MIQSESVSFLSELEELDCLIRETPAHRILDRMSLEYRREVIQKILLEDEDENMERIDPAPIDHPEHYISKGIEAIDVIDAFDLNFCLGNAVKYILRAGRKKNAHRVDDIDKAIWYLNHELKRE